MQLVSTNFGGNLHAACDAINRTGLAEFVLTMDFSGSGTVVVFKVPDRVAPRVRKYFNVLPEYQANPKPERTWDHGQGKV